jgi:hypothetical protein
MANYTVIGRSGEAMPLVSVSIGSIDQEQQVVSDLTIVNAVRECLKAVPGVESVVARKFEQTITIV